MHLKMLMGALPIVVPTPLVEKELYTQRFFCSVNFGRSIIHSREK